MTDQPVWLLALAAFIGGGGLVGGVASIFGSVVTRRLGVQANQNQARADEAAAEDRFMGRLQLENDKLLARAERAETAYSREVEYSRALQDHIWRGRPAPPPERKVHDDG